MADRLPLVIVSGQVEQLQSGDRLLLGSGLVVNEDGIDSDTRIEGDTKTHMIFVQANASAENIALCASAEPLWQSMDGGLFLANADTIPTGNPASGCYLFSATGIPTIRTSGGEVGGLVASEAVFSTDNALLRANGTGRLIQNSVLTLADTTGRIANSSTTYMFLAGSGSDPSTPGDDLIIIGNNAGSSATIGNNSMLIGEDSGNGMSAGVTTFMLGLASGLSSSFGASNTGFGGNALREATATNFNIAIGASAGQGATMGSQNHLIGVDAGRSLDSTSANFNVFIGGSAGNDASQKTDVVRSVAIGHGTFTTANNQVVIGSSLVTSTLVGGGLTVNDAGHDADSRIEGDTKTHMIFVDASAATENVALVASSAPNWQNMDGGLFIQDADTVPTGDPASGVFLYSEGADLKTRNGVGAVTQLSGVTRGATASVTDGATITHGLGSTPVSVLATGSVAGEIITVTTIGATTFTVAIKQADGTTAGTSQTIYWQASE